MENVSTGKTILTVSLILLIVGLIGYFSLSRGQWPFYASAHLGALGILGLFGWTAGRIALWKKRSFSFAFSLGFLLPILIGIASVLYFWLPEGGRLFCGGSVILGVAILTLITYLLLRKRAV